MFTAQQQIKHNTSTPLLKTPQRLLQMRQVLIAAIITFCQPLSHFPNNQHILHIIINRAVAAVYHSQAYPVLRRQFDKTEAGANVLV